jgi:hypothetical protein
MSPYQTAKCTSNTVNVIAYYKALSYMYVVAEENQE